MNGTTTILVVSTLLFLGSATFGSSAWAEKITCPEIPKEVRTDIVVETHGKIAALGKLSGAEFKNRTEIIAKDVLEKVPNLDRVLVVRMLTNLFCQVIAQSTQLSDKEKLDRFRQFTDQINSLINPSTPPPSPDKSKRTSPPKSLSPPGLAIFITKMINPPGSERSPTITTVWLKAIGTEIYYVDSITVEHTPGIAMSMQSGAQLPDAEYSFTFRYDSRETHPLNPAIRLVAADEREVSFTLGLAPSGIFPSLDFHGPEFA